MKTYENDGKSRRVWYDPCLRLWTLQCLDPAGYQVGEVEYAVTKSDAFEWLSMLID